MIKHMETHLEQRQQEPLSRSVGEGDQRQFGGNAEALLYGAQ